MHVRVKSLFAILWTAGCQAPLSMGFSSQEYWSGSSCSPPGDLLTQGLNPSLLRLLFCQTDSLPLGSIKQDTKLQSTVEQYTSYTEI